MDQSTYWFILALVLLFFMFLIILFDLLYYFNPGSVFRQPQFGEICNSVTACQSPLVCQGLNTATNTLGKCFCSECPTCTTSTSTTTTTTTPKIPSKKI